MSYFIALGVFSLIFIVIGLVSHRNMAIPTLTLGAGALLSELWADRLTGLLAEAGVMIDVPPLWSLVAVVLTVIPALIVLMRAPKARSFIHSLFGSIVFALFVVMLTRQAFDGAVIIDESSANLREILTTNAAYLLTACVVIALIQVFIRKKRPPLEHDKKHKK